MPQADIELSDADLRAFDEGYLVVPILDADEIAALKEDIDTLAAGENGGKPLGQNLTPRARERVSRLVRSPLLHQLPGRQRAHELPSIARLTWHPRVLRVLDQIMASWRPRAEWTLAGGPPPVLDLPDDPARSRYVFHHINAARHDAGTRGLPWHHDYDQYPQTNRSHLMVHVLTYLNGLNGSVGDLMLAPGTHRSVASKRALWHMGWEKLPGAVVIDDLPPGSAVFMNSAMFHARIPKPGGEDEPRYFIDCSYCQGGIQWPSAYGGSHRQLRERHLAEGGDRPWLFDERQFFDSVHAHNATENAQGSLLADPRYA
ncbi:phytanoyl-CoA dioxygenase family protein [Nonomuraea purpurea]|uniref:Phytanoyl-CoA dioxygenase family protein n=1 Tax=Nonomuraea purpurea TaxID=1849276 RepID=A0ABV8GNR4_9ACTN